MPHFRSLQAGEGGFLIRQKNRKLNKPLIRSKTAAPKASKCKIALLTDEYPNLAGKCGGLGNWVVRMSTALAKLGHEVEIFVDESGFENPIPSPDSVRVNSCSAIGRRHHHLLRIPGRIQAKFRLKRSIRALRIAAGLAGEFHRRDKLNPFDIVHCTNCSLSGYYIRKSAKRSLITRMSSCRWLWANSDGLINDETWADYRLLSHLERRLIKKADFAYAPSSFLARYLSQSAGVDLGVVYPPMFLEAEPKAPSFHLPSQYLLHFGTLMERKGTDLVAAALPLVWAKEPDFRMVWCGRERTAGFLEGIRAKLGTANHKLLLTGPLPKEELYGVIRGSIATVLPSRVDNLPNTVIESLLCQTPVIGTDGASIDELVEAGSSGELVQLESVESLANAMIRAWRSESPFLGNRFRTPKLVASQTPETAARNLLLEAKEHLPHNAKPRIQNAIN